MPRLGRDVAQPGSAPASGAGGRRFESSRPDQWIMRRSGLFALLDLTLVDRPVHQPARGQNPKRSRDDEIDRLDCPMQRQNHVGQHQGQRDVGAKSNQACQNGDGNT